MKFQLHESTLFIPCIVVVTAFIVFNARTHGKYLSPPERVAMTSQDAVIKPINTTSNDNVQEKSTDNFWSLIGHSDEKLEEREPDLRSLIAFDYDQKHRSLSALDCILGCFSLLPFLIIPFVYVDYKRLSKRREEEEE